MYTAIVWIGQYGSWSQTGFETLREARAAATAKIASGAFGTRSDLLAQVTLA